MLEGEGAAALPPSIMDPAVPPVPFADAYHKAIERREKCAPSPPTARIVRLKMAPETRGPGP